MTRRRPSRRGVALIATLAAITLLGVLALASARVARARLVGARRVLGVHAAALAATRTLDSALAHSRAADWAPLPIGAERAVPSARTEPLVLRRLQSRLFRLDVAAQRGDAIAPTRHAASLLVRADAPRLDRGAPLVAGASVVIASDFRIDARPAGAACDGDVATPLVLAADSAAVRWEDPAAAEPVRELPALRAPEAFDREVARLRTAAELTLADAAHYAPTSDSARAVFADGDLTLGPGTGAGVLVAMGRLTIVGPLRFRGSILAMGGVTTGGPGIELAGTLVSMGTARLSGGVLRYDPCDAESAAVSAARLHPLGRWSRATLW